MTVVALTAFVTVTDKNGNEQHAFQNGKYDANVSGHTYLSFIYQGAAMNRTGDNLAIPTCPCLSALPSWASCPWRASWLLTSS